MALEFSPLVSISPMIPDMVLCMVSNMVRMLCMFSITGGNCARLDRDDSPPVRRPAVDAASGPIARYDMLLRGFLFWLDCMLREKHSHETNERFLLGANMAIRAQAWKSVRHLTQLDLEDQLHEDVDLALTLFKNGCEIVYEPSMVAAMSGRRVESSLSEFYHYVTRYTGRPICTASTADGPHDGNDLDVAYYPFRAMRFFYNADNSEFSSAKLRGELRKRASLLQRRNRTDASATAGLLTGA